MTEQVLDPMEVARRNRDEAMRNSGSATAKAAAARGAPAAASNGHDPEHELAAVQALVEGVVPAGKVEFMGEWFRIADKVGLMPLMKFANAADSGLDTADMAGLAAVYSMLEDCIDAADWKRFEQHAIKMKADAEDLLPVTQQVVEILTSRPTRQPSGSSSP